MPNTPTLTANETIVLRACYATEYSDTINPSPWSWSVTDHAGLAPKSMGGIVASLAKKGLVTAHGFSTKRDDSYVYVTDAGAAAALALGLIDVDGNLAKKPAVEEFTPEVEALAKKEVRELKKLGMLPKMTKKNARRIVRAYLRTAIEMAMLAEAGDFDEALDERIHQLDAQLDAALDALAK